MTRVSDRAKFCHHCGAPLIATESVGNQTSRLCPACAEDRPLHSRKLGNNDVSALECNLCAGLWLSNDVFEYLARKAQRNEVSAVAWREPQAPSRPAPSRHSRYRPCPFCRELMNRTNYGIETAGQGSGTIVDVCRAHGIWFDADELTRILDWLGRGGQLPVQKQRSETAWRSSDNQRRPEGRASRDVSDETESGDSLPVLAHHLVALLRSAFDV
jgi:Zn-finger nucleic acid-binding protein